MTCRSGYNKKEQLYTKSIKCRSHYAKKIHNRLNQITCTKNKVTSVLFEDL